jgi:hypothetical protein
LISEAIELSFDAPAVLRRFPAPDNAQYCGFDVQQIKSGDGLG